MVRLRRHARCAILLSDGRTASGPENWANCVGNPAAGSGRYPRRIENVDQRPGTAGQIVVKLSLLIDDELACRIQESCALGRVGVIEVELTDGQVEGRGRRRRVCFIEQMRAAGDKGDPAPGWRQTIWMKATS
jgi:hypothetical protein